jgi:nucleoside-diphosphate-sugar epimerase
VCGYSPRQRLDLTVNILTNHAVNRRKITVFGGAQTRPNIHIEDIAELYAQLLEMPRAALDGKIFNAGHRNASVAEIAESVRKTVEELIPEGGAIEVATSPSDDPRSYRICSEKLERELGFVARRSIEDGVRDLVRAFRAGLLPDSLTDSRYFNIKRMQELRLQ